ncbi:MAG TPA: cyclodeaminase/cyclohydrolase family protein, partial [Acidobacteriota bacterium]|nr:cyclodeaminase/cyclohydrolase family protein [Acidobacteriota bacterium]
ARDEAIVAATRRAIEIPLSVVEAAGKVAELVVRVSRIGMAAAASDFGVAALCARTAAEGAALNVRINLPGLPDAAERAAFKTKLDAALSAAREAAAKALAKADEIIG